MSQKSLIMRTDWYLLLLVFTVAPVRTAIILNFVSKPCDKSNTFLQTFGRSLLDCIDECDRRTRCGTIMYQHGMNHCSLKDNINIISLGNSQSVCMYLKNTDWTDSDLGPCSKRECGAKEKCVTSSENQEKFYCLKTECQLPPIIENAYSLSQIQNIDSVNRYKCKSGYTGFGSPSITCKDDATWTDTDFRCIRICREPKTDINSVSSIGKDGLNLSEGSTVNFTCSKDYQGNGPISSHKCSNGTWVPNRVQCCPNGTVYWPKLKRCIFYTGKITSKDQANAICQSNNSSMANFKVGQAKWMIEKHGDESVWLLAVATKTGLSRKLNFTKCLLSNNFTDTGESKETYDAMVIYIRSNKLTEGECKKVDVWASGEPNGGIDEDCIITGKAFNYLYIDTQCNDLQNFNIEAVCQKNLPVI